MLNFTVALSKHNAKGVFWFLKARLAEFYSQNAKQHLCAFYPTQKLIIVYVNNGKVEGFTI